MAYRSGIVQVVGWAAVAVASFSLGAYSSRQDAALRLSEQEARLEALRAETASAFVRMRGARPLEPEVAPTAGAGVRVPLAVPTDAAARGALLDDLKRELQAEMGLLPIRLLRDRRQSFVELYAEDSHGRSNYGTAGYLGGGYFVTVKHGVVVLGSEAAASRDNPRRIVAIRVKYRGRMVGADLVDSGDATSEVDDGDWAVVKAREPIDLPPLKVDLTYAYHFADPIFRLGNDYSRGIIVSTGHIGQRTPNGLVTCLTDGHPGVSGGGVLSQEGDLVGIPVGRMQGDYRFSFILPLRQEMFRKIGSPLAATAGTAPARTQAEPDAAGTR